MARLLKKVIAILLCTLVLLPYYGHLFYALYLSGLYPVKAQVKYFSVEFDGAWFPAPKIEVPSVFGVRQSEGAMATRVFFKIDGLKPGIQGTMGISWIGDQFEGFSKPDRYSESINFNWGTAKVLKKEFGPDPSLAMVVVPEYKLLISAENLSQLREIKLIKRNAG